MAGNYVINTSRQNPPEVRSTQKTEKTNPDIEKICGHIDAIAENIKALLKIFVNTVPETTTPTAKKDDIDTTVYPSTPPEVQSAIIEALESTLPTKEERNPVVTRISIEKPRSAAPMTPPNLSEPQPITRISTPATTPVSQPEYDLSLYPPTFSREKAISIETLLHGADYQLACDILSCVLYDDQGGNKYKNVRPSKKLLRKYLGEDIYSIEDIEKETAKAFLLIFKHWSGRTHGNTPFERSFRSLLHKIKYDFGVRDRDFNFHDLLRKIIEETPPSDPIKLSRVFELVSFKHPQNCLYA